MTTHWPASGFAPARPSWTTPLAALAGVWTAVLVIFHHDVGDLAGIWWNSTTFGHCLFVAPVIGWLVWQRRAGLAALTPQAWWPGVAIVAVGAATWFVGQAGGIAFARHLGLVVMLQGSVVALLGMRFARALLFPLAYMIFLVPFGEWLEAPLQRVTVAMVMPLLGVAGVPAQVDGVLITIPNGWFEVAEACSGAKFVIAMAAFATLVANVCFVSWRRRILFWTVAMIVPVLANGLRAFGTIYAAHLTSVERATGLDHIVYGWVFFAGVMAGVLAIGWRWFDRDPDAAWFDPARLGAQRRTADRWTVAGIVVGMAAVAYMAGALAASRADALPAQLRLPDVAGWQRVGIEPARAWSPFYPTADHQLIGRYADRSGHRVDLAIAVYAGQREGHELVGFGQGVLRENDRWVKVADTARIAGGRVERITAPGPVERSVATWYRLGGMTTSDDRTVKIETLKAKLLGGPQVATAVHLSAEGPQAREGIATFLRAAGPAGALADTIVAGS